MTRHIQTGSGPEQSDLGRMAQFVLNHPDDANGLDRYFKAAVDTHNFEAARKTFDLLQRQYPGDHRIRRLSIALCLHQEDYQAAMEAIETLVAFSALDDALIQSALQVRAQLGPRTTENTGKRGTTLSVCMIVKNEQSYLGPCLNAMKTLADEIVVVDTGSSDHSVDLARIYGAHVHHRQWCDDFSDARNHALGKASGQWVLILDADEIIAGEDQLRIRELIDGHRCRPKAFSFETRNYTYAANGLNWQYNDQSYPEQEAGLGWFPSNKVRLFPRLEGLHFSYPVHELVEPAIERAGVAITKSDIPIHHYGNLNETRNRTKAKRYFSLGYAKLEKLGNDKGALRELAIQAGQIGRWGESVELWHRFLSLCPDDGEAYANLSGASWQMARFEDGINFARNAIRNAPAMKEGHYNLAANLLFSGRPEEAAEILRTVTGAHENYMAARFMLAATYAVVGQVDRCLPLLRRLAERLSPDGLDAALKELRERFHVCGHDGFGDALHQAAQIVRSNVNAGRAVTP